MEENLIQRHKIEISNHSQLTVKLSLIAHISIRSLIIILNVWLEKLNNL